MRGEFDLIEWLRRKARQPQSRAQKNNSSSFILHPSSLLLGIGDDAALFAQTKNHATVITTDLLIEDVDFRRAWNAPYALGWKALAVSLSDVAAMGATPRYALTSIGIPADLWRTKFVEKFYAGWFALAEKFSVALIGGDVSRAPERIAIDSIALGEVKRQSALRRDGARVGDHIFVTGALGGAAAGLKLIEAGARLSAQAMQADAPPLINDQASFSARRKHLLRRQLMPQPRVAWGAYLAANKLATALLDISDGLSSDLAHLCAASKVGAEIELNAVPSDAALTPVLPELKSAQDKNSGQTVAQNFALHGGEDFELLFTVAPRRCKQIPAEIDGVPARCIGRILEDSQTRLWLRDGVSRARLHPAGFTHF